MNKGLVNGGAVGSKMYGRRRGASAGVQTEREMAMSKQR